MNAFPYRGSQFKILSVLTFAALLYSCGPSGPKPPPPGTPAFHWLAAQEAYKAGDYVKTNELLVQLSLRDSEYAERARPWALVMSLGFANAYMELAEKLGEGAKMSRDPAPFRRFISGYKAKATAAAMQYAEVALRFTDANKDKDVTFVFDLPQAALDDPPEYLKIAGGRLIPEAELASVEKYVIRHEVLQNACRALNAPKDPEKAKSAYQNGEAKVQGSVFLLTMAQGLYAVSEMFGPKKLDQPPRIIITLYDEALQALALVKENKEAKNLTRKITDAKKKVRV